MSGDNGIIERAMTQDACDVLGVQSGRRDVVMVAQRMLAWDSAPEVCKSCQTHPARSIAGGLALCPRCREQRSQQHAIPIARGRLAVDRQRAVPDEAGFNGHAVVFHRLSLDLGGFVERIQPDAVNRTFTENLDVVALWNHQSGDPLGRTSEGTVTIWKDATGLAFAIRPPTSASRQLEAVQRRDVKGMSFGFQVVEEDWALENGVPTRDILDMRMREISCVTFPAYPGTDVSVGISGRRSIEWLRMFHKTALAK